MTKITIRQAQWLVLAIYKHVFGNRMQMHCEGIRAVEFEEEGETFWGMDKITGVFYYDNRFRERVQIFFGNDEAFIHTLSEGAETWRRRTIKELIERSQDLDPSWVISRKDIPRMNYAREFVWKFLTKEG